MAFSKGRSGNPKGRPRGAKGKAPAMLAEQVHHLVEDNIEQLKTDLKALSPADRVKAIIKLLDFVIPKFSKIETEVRKPIKQMSQIEAREFIEQLDKEY